MAEPHPLSFCVVTATYNRLHLLARLHASLLQQDDTTFTWVVVDDASSDQTGEWLNHVKEVSPFRIEVIRNGENAGKAASLNKAFDSHRADFYLIVDSDDSLIPGGVSLAKRRALADLANDQVGALFFVLIDRASGEPLGHPPGGLDTVCTRSELDSRHGKYDGCVGYFARAVENYSYPTFPNETYVGPTVLQLMMEPEFKIHFLNEVVGIAEYQPDGLSSAGRRLRIENPRGMMVYSMLRATKDRTSRSRVKNAIGYWAYRSFLPVSRGGELGLGHATPSRCWRPAGVLVARRWERQCR